MGKYLILVLFITDHPCFVVIMLRRADLVAYRLAEILYPALINADYEEITIYI